MDPIHPLVYVGLTLLMMGIIGGLLLLMAWNSRRIHRNRQAGHTAQPGAPAPVGASLPAVVAPPPATAPAVPDRLVPLPQWRDLVQNRLDDAPHTLIIGPSGTGKTTLVKALCATRRGQLLFVSPKPNAWPGLTYPTIDDDSGFTEIEAAMQAVLVELRQRLTAMKRGIDPATFTTLTIIVDEFPTVVDECATAPDLLRKLGQIGRELRLRLIALSTTRQVKDLGIEGRGAARDNFAEITLPRSTARVSGVFRLAADDTPQMIALAGVLELSQQPIDPARWWVLPAQPVAAVADAVAGIAIMQNESIPVVAQSIAQPVAEAKVPDSLGAQHDWLTVARLVKAKAIGQTEALKALGFPPGNGGNYLQARDHLQAALRQLEPAAPITNTTTQPLRSPQTA